MLNFLLFACAISGACASCASSDDIFTQANAINKQQQSEVLLVTQDRFETIFNVLKDGSLVLKISSPHLERANPCVFTAYREESMVSQAIARTSELRGGQEETVNLQVCCYDLPQADATFQFKTNQENIQETPRVQILTSDSHPDVISIRHTLPKNLHGTAHHLDIQLDLKCPSCFRVSFAIQPIKGPFHIFFYFLHQENAEIRDPSRGFFPTALERNLARLPELTFEQI